MTRRVSFINERLCFPLMIKARGSDLSRWKPCVIMSAVIHTSLSRLQGTSRSSGRRYLFMAVKGSFFIYQLFDVRVVYDFRYIIGTFLSGLKCAESQWDKSVRAQRGTREIFLHWYLLFRVYSSCIKCVQIFADFAVCLLLKEWDVPSNPATVQPTPCIWNTGTNTFQMSAYYYC